MRRFLLAILIFGGSVASAQTPPPPTSYDLVMTGATQTTYSFPAAQAICNVTTDPGVPGTLNPRYLVWNDAVNAGRICVHDTGNGTGPLFALPIGDYTGILYAVASTGTQSVRSDPSNTVGFSRLVPSAARTGFRVRGAS